MKTYLEIVMMLLATLSALLAATPPSSLDALRKSVAFHGAQLSPDGKQLAWVESVSGPEGRRMVRQVAGGTAGMNDAQSRGRNRAPATRMSLVTGPVFKFASCG